jgi:hypothetical protein
MLMLHFYVEEESAEHALIELIPRILDPLGEDYGFDIFTFQGKPDLLRKLPTRLKAYQHRNWEDWRVFILVDRDGDDCRELKRKLEDIAQDAGLTTKTASPTGYQVVNRIVVEELEAWFFGDVEALCTAYTSVPTTLAAQAKYRDPDAIAGGTAEALERLLKDDHPNGLGKVRAAQDIARHMQPERNRSASFRAFRDAVLGVFA